jgi:hypothetical protein
MRDVHRYAAAHMVRVHGSKEAAERARRNYFTILGNAGVEFWADVMVAVNQLRAQERKESSRDQG